MSLYKKIDVSISKFLKYFVYKLEEDVSIEYTRKFQRKFNKDTDEFDGIAYIKRTYILKHNGRWKGTFKTQQDLLNAMIELRNEIDPSQKDSEEKKNKVKEGESNA